MKDITANKRLIKLFKYLLIYKNIKLLPENIIEDLYIDDDFKNPLNILRTQISRLRKILSVNQYSYALIHYEFFTKKLFNDLSMPPSKEIKEIYKRIKIKEDNNNPNIDVNKIDKTW